MSENNNNDLNEVFEEEMDDADVITVPIDETLSNSGEAADAAAVGAALALKADKDELPATIKVNGQQADNQGLILINGTHIPVNGSTQKTLAEAVSEVSGMTAETIPMSEETGAATIAAEIEDIKEDVSDLQEAIDGMEEKTADNIPMETGSTTTVKNAIETLDRKAVKSVNRKLPDAAGDVDLSVVPLAENLQSDKLQSIEGEFIIRTTGGNGAVADGKAYPQHIYGNCQHNGYVAEVLNLTVIPITRTEPDEPITATIDRDTFVAAVDESSTINLYYTTEWSEDPADYGVTVTGEPVAGDQITIVYVKEQRGTILVADPDRLVGTGWNLFNANDGYARVVKYSDVYGYKIGGTYTSIAFSATLTGDRTSLLPNANGLFNVPSDGYVFVTGGNATNTYILATWSDWTNGPSTGYWEAYRESGIDLSAVVETYFPYGMLKIGAVSDEIDLVAKRSISRIERMVYSEENRAAAAATGRAYDFDENNIYIVRAEYVQNAITISTEYSVSEHGLEWFTETDLPLDTEILYGKNLRDKLERDVLTISPQNLVAEEQAQVRRNIGVMDPPLNGNGTAAQLLKTNGDGTTEWTTQGTPTDAQVGTAVSAWLTAHPEATTTVQDGAISRSKLNDDLKAKTDVVPDLKSAFNQETQLVADGVLSLDDGVVTQYDVNPVVDFTLASSTINASTGGLLKVFPVTAGKEYTIHFVGGNHRRYGFTNTIADGSALNDYHSYDSAFPSTIDVTAPSGYAYLVVYYATVSNEKNNGKATVYITSESKLQKQITENAGDIENIETNIGLLQEDVEELDDSIEELSTSIQNNNESILQNKKQYKQFSTSSGSTEYRCTQTDSNIGETISLTESSNWSVWKMDCSKMSMIFAFLRHPNTNTNALWIFVDENEKIIKTGRNSVLETISEWYDITSVPNKAKYVYIFTNRGSSTANKTLIYYSEYVEVDKQFEELTNQNLDRLFFIRKIIPSYYWAFSESSSSLANNEWLNQKIASIPSGKSFIFITDTHWESNNQKSIELIDYIKQKAGIETVLFGGDAMNGENDKYLGVGRLRSDINPFVDTFGKSFIVVPGNHDLNAFKLIGEQSPTTEQINNTLIPYTYEESILTGHLQPYIVKDRGYNLDLYASDDNLTNLNAYMGLHYYIDDTKNKIRYIVLNSGNTYSGIIRDIFGIAGMTELLLQYDWYAEALRTIPDGFDVVVSIHEFLFGIDNWYPAMRARGVITMLNARMKKTEGTMYLNPSSEIAQNANLTSYFPTGTHTYDFSGCGNVGKGIIMNGHWHIDMAIASDKTLYTEYGQNININSGSSYSGVLAITTQCDRKVSTPVEHQSATTDGTITEQCFDIVTIASDGIHCTRIGAGSDRVFYYAT